MADARQLAAADRVRTHAASARPAAASDVAAVWTLLEAVTDPEIPVITLRDLGILRDVRLQGGKIEVVITPTYSGCPAMSQIEDDVRAVLQAHGVAARVVTQFAPAWTTDWITERGRRRLREYGIAPPHAQAASNVVRFAIRKIANHQDPVTTCPRCGSQNTTETSHFGSTACKALYRCLDCMEPFDLFKPH
jgi:ring-1,2-phenylacetyl-CoA epoxidase subunit PaaD